MTIRDVPEDTLRAIKVRAAKEGKSLQGFLHELIDLFRRAPLPPLSRGARMPRRAGEVVSVAADSPAIVEAGKARTAIRVGADQCE